MRPRVLSLVLAGAPWYATQFTQGIAVDSRKRVYVVCGEGKVNVFREDDPGHYVAEESIPTAPRARTGLFVPEEGRLYVAAPAVADTAARILVYQMR